MHVINTNSFLTINVLHSNGNPRAVVREHFCQQFGGSHVSLKQLIQINLMLTGMIPAHKELNIIGSKGSNAFLLNVKQNILINITNEEISGHHLCMFQKNKVVPKQNVFQCKNTEYISHASICDGKVDCTTSMSDENVSICSGGSKGYDYGIYVKKTISRIKCSPVHYMNIFGKCSKFYMQEMLKRSHDSHQFFVFKNKANINKLLTDSMPLCDQVQSYDPRANLIMQHVNRTNICKPHKVPCTYNVQNCYAISDICIYILDLYLHIVPCASGEHLQECKLFQCNAMFKCPSSYCLPWKYVCDGKWDCPEGNDETPLSFV